MDSTSWDQRYTGHPSPWTDEPNRFLVDAVAGLDVGTALDLACGEGRNTLWLARQGWDVTGVDFSAVAISRGRRMAVGGGLAVRFQRHDLLKWAPHTRAYDLVTMAYLQMPADDMAVAVGNAARAVAPGGTLFVVGHHLDNLINGVGGPSSPEVLYTELQLVSWCGDLEVIRAERLHRQVDEGVAIDALLVARR